MLDHRLFHPVGVQMRGVASCVLLVANAEEVPVVPAVPTRRALDNHAAQNRVRPTPTTEQAALEIVVVDSAAFAGHPMLIEHPLHPVERLLVDEWLVAAGDLLPLVGNDADVVVAAEEPRPLLCRYRLRDPLRRATGTKPAVAHDALYIGQAVIASGIELPGLLDQWTTLGIDLDRANLSAVVGLQ
nr:hypothetical protein [Nocardia huaxiensis]